jgi:hypothetical protein
MALKVWATSQIMSAVVFYAAETYGSGTWLGWAPGSLIFDHLELASPVP